MNDPTTPGDQGPAWAQALLPPGFAPAQTPPGPQNPSTQYGLADPSGLADAPQPPDDFDAYVRQTLGDQNYTALSRLIASRPTADPTAAPTPSAPMSTSQLLAQALRNLGDKSGFASPPATDPAPALSPFAPVSRPAMLAEALRAFRDKNAVNPPPAFAPGADMTGGNQSPSNTTSDPFNLLGGPTDEDRANLGDQNAEILSRLLRPASSSSPFVRTGLGLNAGQGAGDPGLTAIQAAYSPAPYSPGSASNFAATTSSGPGPAAVPQPQPTNAAGLLPPTRPSGNPLTVEANSLSTPTNLFSGATDAAAGAQVLAGKAGDLNGAASVAVDPNMKTPPARMARSATASGNVVTYVNTDGAIYTLTGPHPNRDNNPMNMLYGKLAQSYGAIGNDNGFAIFPNLDQGYAAQIRNMNRISRVTVGKVNQTRQPDGTIAAMVYAWTPFGQRGNNPEQIIKDLNAWTGIGRNTQLSSLTNAQQVALAHAYARAEGFHPN